MKLTEEAIEALACEPGQKDRLVFDDTLPGLAVRITAGGRKFFLAQYTVAGQRRRVPIGRWGAVTLKAARTAAKGILGDVAKGQDVAAVRTAERVRVKGEAAADKLTLDALLEQWSDMALIERRPSYRKEAVRAVKAAFPGHLTRRAEALTRADALAGLDALGKAGKPTMAGRTLAYARACYTWAMKRGKVSSNPFLALPISTGTVSRDRVLTDAEVALIWTAAGELGHPFGPLVRVLLLTAQRRDEVGGMRWSELSGDRTTWTIPKERAKNGRAHVVHLAPTVRAILADVPRFAWATLDGEVRPSPDLVFTTTGKTPVSGYSNAKDALEAHIAKARTKAAAAAGQKAPPALQPWRMHDFRRTAVTWMAGNGVAPHVADRLLNHVQGTISGVAAVYQRQQFLAERKAALEVWAGHVVGMIG
ncbi:MAG TPA: site-specific integrase [Acetobacteraceae bacterium]